MSSGSLVILKSIRYNNLYYLMGSTVTRSVSLGQLEGDSVRKQSPCFVPIVVISGEDAPRPDRLGRRSGYKPQDLLRQLEKKNKKIFQGR